MIGEPDVTIIIVGMNGNLSFSPNPGVVPVGKTVAWRDGDYGVTRHITADNNSFTTGDIPAGSVSTPIMMSAAGPVPYHCQIHPTMTGTLNVQ